MTSTLSYLVETTISLSEIGMFFPGYQLEGLYSQLMVVAIEVLSRQSQTTKPIG